MKKATNRILSFLSAFAMVLGILVAPFTSNAAQTGTATAIAGTAKEETITTVTLHKIKLTKLDDTTIPKQKDGQNYIEGLGTKKEQYVGGKIQDIQDFFNDTTAEELDDVKFTYWVFNNAEAYKEMLANPNDFDTIEKVDAKLGTKDVTKKPIESKKGGVALDAVTVPAGENRFIWAVETSSVIAGKDVDGKKAEDKTITGMKAVPFGLALPLFKEDGSVNTAVHVYPKNTTANQPKVDKDFKGKANAEEERKEVDNTIVKDVYVGQEVPYEIETIIPEGTKYKTAAWTDQMTEGLTFDKNSVKISIGAKDAEKPLDAADYTVTEDHNGFVLELTEAGLAKINEKTEKTRIHITYKATVNKNAKVEREERNDVIFHFGNNPEHGNTPYPTKPNEDGKLTVTKDFPNVKGGWAPGEEVEVTIVDAHTGKPVEFTDGQKATVTLKEDGEKSHEWTGLDKDRQYKVVETFKAGDQVTYEYKEDGTVIIHDKATDNPTPLNPQEPAVKPYGHRFQKVDQATGEGIKDAEFVVVNKIAKVKFDSTDETGVDNTDLDKVLAKKTETEVDVDQETYAKAEKAYKDAVAEATKEKPDTENIANLKKIRDEAYLAANTEWKWIDKADDDYTGAYKFVSNEDGYFKLSGVQLGNYELVETKAPKGYAKLTKAVPFEVKADSNGETNIETKKDEGLTQVNNKKVTIPQTGGIGSLIFIVAGLAIMGIAFTAMKKRNAANA